MKTIDQIRAQFAWERVQEPSKEYKNLAKSLPALIMSNGLMQTLAFLKAKGANEHERLLKDILSWLQHEEMRLLGNSDSGFAEAMQIMTTTMDALTYQRATEEALAVLKWIRYLAQTI